MSLTGTLDAFPLPEVLRLLERASKTGCLRLEAGGVQAKVYLDAGRAVYGTTRADEDLRNELTAAAIVDGGRWSEVEARERRIAEIVRPDASDEALTSFVRERVVDALFRIERSGFGTFDFGEDERPRYDMGVELPVEEVIAEARSRVDEWREIEAVIPSPAFRMRMVPRLPDNAAEVRLPAATWELLAALGSAASVEDLAERLATTEFSVARSMAKLVRQGLVELIDGLPEARYSYGESEAATEGVATADGLDGEADDVEEDEASLADALRAVVGSDDDDDDLTDVAAATGFPRRRGLGDYRPGGDDR